MGLLVVSVVFLLTVALGAALAKGVLTLVVHLLVERDLPATGSLMR